MDKLTRNQTSIIFQTRTRMLKVKDNYKNKYKTDMKCRACGQQAESQSHILRECQTLHQNQTSKITEAEITTEDINTLKETATKIEEIMRRLIADPPGTASAAGAPADLGIGPSIPEDLRKRPILTAATSLFPACPDLAALFNRLRRKSIGIIKVIR